MYASTDPRAVLQKTTTTDVKPPTSFGPANYGRFYDGKPQEADALHRTWYTRGENFLIAYSEVKAGATFRRKEQPDEYMLLLSDAESAVRVRHAGETHEIKGRHVVFIPPGDSTVEVAAPGRITRFLTTRSKDLVAICGNTPSYEPDPNTAPLKPWPDPPGGFKVRAYSLEVPMEAGRFGRLFRCTTFMLNFFDVREGPKDIKLLSPHQHDDFQQCGFLLSGTCTHHLRWPWLVDGTQWRDDTHETVEAPSAVFIPARVIHTCRSIGERNHLLDIFCPPRADFSAPEGWVLNAADYPAPAP
jgi:hypothetical protein